MSSVSEEATQSDNTFYIRQGDSKDGYAEVTVAPDGASVSASFYPPAPGGAFLTYPACAAKLDEQGIRFGLIHEMIQESVLKANATHTPVKNVIIARASPPVTEIPEHFVVRKDLIDRKPDIDPDAQRVDWHSISAFSIVKARDPIARRIAKVDGVSGQDVYGNEMSASVEKLPEFSAGTNVIEHETGLFAGKSGRLSIDPKGVISIEDVLVLKKGVDFTTGNVSFPGDIILQGKVADGFKVYSGGSIISSEVVDVTEIVCKKDMVVQAGIEGKKTGALRIGGNLTAKYIQNCRVAVRGDVLVSGSIVQSTVYSMGMIKMGDTGKLVGCECIVVGGIQALDIGNARGSKTHVRCGTDFTVQQELDIANEQLRQIAVRLAKAEETYADEPLPDIGKYIEELKAKRAEINARIPSYLPRIDRNDEAYVEVRGSVYPGTEIEICHVPFSVTKVMKSVVFRLDKVKGAIVTTQYKKS